MVAPPPKGVPMGMGRSRATSNPATSTGGVVMVRHGKPPRTASLEGSSTRSRYVPSGTKKE
jgi:hypothetical protein